MTDLVTFGESMLRLSPPGNERLETVDELEVHAAGAESNVAVAAQRLGLDATWLSKVPDSPLGRRLTGTLANNGVDTAVVWDEDGRLGTYYVEFGGKPRGTEVIYDRAGSSVTTATPSELDVGLVETADMFHTTGITPALSPTLEETTARLLSTASDAGTTTVFDLNYREKLWSPARARETIEELLPVVDLLVVADRDAEAVLGLDGSAEEMARELDADYDQDVTIVSRGAEGSLAVAHGEVYEQSVFETDDTDPVGSGDAFLGGFLARYHEGASVPEALEYGTATASLKRTIPGDMALVTPEEVADVISREDDDGISR